MVLIMNDQNMESSTQTNQREGSFLEEANFKVGRYSAEERKEKISKYRAKRSQRNFNKTIKVNLSITSFFLVNIKIVFRNHIDHYKLKF